MSIESHRDILDSLNLTEIDSLFAYDFLVAYKSNLSSNQSEYKDIEIQGYKGVQYQQILSIDRTNMYNNSIVILANIYSYTFSVMTNNKEDEDYFYSFINSIEFADSNMNSNVDPKIYQNYISPKYTYHINIPLDFVIEKAIGKNIDLKLVNEIGCSFTVNVTERLSEEYSINAHDYSKDIMESIMRPKFPNFRIHEADKVYIDGERSFLYIYSNNDGLTAIGCYIFHNDKVYVLTGTSPERYFDSYRELFLNSIMSLKF